MIEIFNYFGIATISSIITAIITFLTTKHKLKEYVRDKNELITKKIHDLELRYKDLEYKDELQQQVINQLNKNMDELIAKMLKVLKERKITIK